MRILHVFECRDGGVLSVVQMYAAAQARQGHEVHVLAQVDRVPEATWHEWRVDRSRPATFGGAGREVRRTVRRLKPDIVHLHSFFAGAIGRAALIACSRPPVVYQPHSWAYEAVTSPAGRLLVTVIERLLDPLTDRLVVNCLDELLEARRHRVGAPGSAVGVPIDLHRYRPVDPAQRAQLRSTFARREHMVLCVGRLVRQKGQDRLVSAWRRDPVPDAELVLVGDGDSERIRDLAGPEWGRSIRWVGNQRDVRPWLWAADVLVVPSRYEGQSVAVSEALACGLPVVMSAVNGASGAVVDGPLPPAGAVVGLDDMTSLVDECRRRVLEAPLCESEARAARVRATAIADVGAVTPEVERVYRDAMRHRGRRPLEDRARRRRRDRLRSPGTLGAPP